jgi:RHH-type proline utilization regulon transcriptional repressor/proline dehydrogenase/delta 1-pyrroline-5-carboxylate dehydrogenase
MTTGVSGTIEAPPAVPSGGQESALSRMRALHRAPEPEVLAGLLPHARLTPAARSRVVARAQGLIADIRSATDSNWVSRFLARYRLDSEEGIALLSLAEAFLRVPDALTADLLIRDRIGSADWDTEDPGDDALIRSATWGLVITRALARDSESPSALKRLVARAGEPFVRTGIAAAMKLMARVFVMGRTIEEALERAGETDFRPFAVSFDMLGEAARTRADAERYLAAYADAIRAVGREGSPRGHSVSVKLSALDPRYETAHAEAAIPALAGIVRELAGLAAANQVRLTIDAEEQDRLLLSLDIIEAVAFAPGLSGWDGLGMAVQAYGKRARSLIDWAEVLAEASGRRIGVRLVKGAYWDTEVKRTQEAGLDDYALFTRKAATDVSYLACARAMLERPRLYPAFGSHNALTVATILERAAEMRGPSFRDFEFQRLHGMGDGLYERLVTEEGYRCRLYAPVGGHRDLLAYLVRRLLENGANSSFVHQLADPDVGEAELLADPADKVARTGGQPHPSIPRPIDLFQPERRNSRGIDLGDGEVLGETMRAVARARQGAFHAAPLVAGKAQAGAARAVRSPADPGETVGTVVDSSPEAIEAALAAAAVAQPAWNAVGVEPRAKALEHLADRLEADTINLLALLQAEAGKTLPDALAEVREAVDFCRYYAARARPLMVPERLPGPTGEENRLSLHGRGVWATIAPWNFPLAIFLGQTVAALVTGNSVAAKPAPQTPLIAACAIAHAHAAGIPTDVLHLLPGGGEVGAALVGDRRVAGVAFTGSTVTAKRIARTLLDDAMRPIVPLIAETGGLNAMLVDSTALPEQVVHDVITSAFRSAGQRCSALRLLLLQEDVAEHILEMLKGAMDCLVVGDPRLSMTDVGPVIDAAARNRLLNYLDASRNRIVHRLQAPEPGWFVPPSIVRLGAISELREEWFGPILHVATWKAGTLAQTVAKVNASGFGLTMGLHSRIAAAAEDVAAMARVGNLYVNRAMIGAVVGSQPFGGEGLSGTGPKAGGPHYLPRFCLERAVSIDTTSAGGNASLLSIED